MKGTTTIDASIQADQEWPCVEFNCRFEESREREQENQASLCVYSFDG